MGFLGEIRKLLFGVKSVSKSAGRKVADKAEDIGEDILDKSADFFDDAKEMASDAGDKIAKGFGNIKDKVSDAGKDTASSAGKVANSIGNKAKEVTQKIAENPVVEKAADISEKVGAKVLDVGEDLVEKGMDISEKVGEKVLDVTDKIMDKAKDIASDIGEKFDDTMEKAEKMAAEEKANPKQEFADTPLDASGSLLDGSDDFFSKAAAYADGDHGAFSEGKITISEDITPTEKSTGGKAAGFDDLDGDGDEIADDAIIIEEVTEEVTEALPAGKVDVVEEAQKTVEGTDVSEEVKSMVDQAKEQVSDTIDSTVSEAQELLQKSNDLVSERDIIEEVNSDPQGEEE